MMILAICFLCISVFYTATLASSTKPDLLIPNFVLPQGTFNATCKGKHPVRIRVHHCSVLSESSYQENGVFYTELQVAHVDRECNVHCFSGPKRVMKKVSLIGLITSKHHNVTVLKGLPITLSCLSKFSSDSYRVMWITNNLKTTKFVNDDEYTAWTSPSYKNTQYHHLTIHSAITSADYRCLLVDVSGKIIDYSEQHVHVEEPGDDGVMKQFIDYVKPYFKWANYVHT